MVSTTEVPPTYQEATGETQTQDIYPQLIENGKEKEQDLELKMGCCKKHAKLEHRLLLKRERFEEKLLRKKHKIEEKLNRLKEKQMDREDPTKRRVIQVVEDGVVVREFGGETESRDLQRAISRALHRLDKIQLHDSIRASKMEEKAQRKIEKLVKKAPAPECCA